MIDKKVFYKSKSNHWTMYVSADKYPNKMVCTTVSYVTDSLNGDYFLVSDEFVSYARTLYGTMKCLIVNNPECYGSGIYVNTSTTKPIFQIPYKNNPIPVENLVIWKYDHTTRRKMHPLHKDVTITYPNIYDFTRMITDTDACIEWLEPLNDVSAFDSYLQNYIDCYKEDYVDMVQNKTAHQLVLDFSPIQNFNFTSEEYFSSEYHGDSRAWRLSKLIEILKENPMRYEEFVSKFYYNNREFISASYTYESDQHIYERSIMDSREHCDNADERLIIFKEPHTFIKVYNSSCESRYCNLYINGVKKPISYNMTYGSDMYIYFPLSYIKNHENIHIDIGLTNSNIVNQTFQIDFTDGYFALKNTKKFGNISTSNLVYYIDGSRRYIDYSMINYRLRVTMEKIQYVGSSDAEIFIRPASEVFVSSENELYSPNGFDYILLSTEKSNIELSKPMYYKKMNLTDLELSVSNPSYIKRNLHIASTNFYFIRTFNITEDMSNGILEFKEFKGKPIKERFHLYLDGLLVNPDLYSIQFPNIYNGTVKITDINFGIGSLIVEYISYDEIMNYNGKISDLKKTADDILYLDDVLDTPFDVNAYKIYIDGYRIHSNQITTIGQNNIININHIREVSEDSIITIYSQQNDSDPYQYEPSLHFLSEVSKDDDVFRQYMVDTFNKK